MHGHSSIEIKPWGKLGVAVPSHFGVILLVTCWRLSRSIFVSFRFSSSFLSNRLKLLPATQAVFVNSLWQKTWKAAKGTLFQLPLVCMLSKLFQRLAWQHDHRCAALLTLCAHRSCWSYWLTTRYEYECITTSLYMVNVAKVDFYESNGVDFDRFL